MSLAARDGSTPGAGRIVARTRRLVTVAAAVALTGCIGSGKVAHVSDIEPLPPGITVAADQSMGCREGESGFDYRFIVLTGDTDLSDDGALLRALRDNGFYHSIGLPDDLPWTLVGYQHNHHPLRAEIGNLAGYLTNPVAHEGPDPASLPASVRDRPEDAILVALRPTDFACSTPL